MKKFKEFLNWLSQTIQDLALIVIMFLALPFIFLYVWIIDKAYKTLENSYFKCPHNKVGNDPHFMLRTCKECQSDMNVKRITKQAIIRYEKVLRRLSHE